MSDIREVPLAGLDIVKSAFYETKKQHVVIIRRDYDGALLGGGVFVSSDGMILTAAHLLLDEADVEAVSYDGQQLECEVVEVDQLRDLALVRVNGGNFSPAPLSDCNLEFLMPVHFIGHSRGLSSRELKYSYKGGGYVSVPSRQVRNILLEKSTLSVGEHKTCSHDDFDTISPHINVVKVVNMHGCGRTGGTGAPIFHANGGILGIYSFMFRDADYIIPVDEIRDFLEKIDVSFGSISESSGGKEKRKQEVVGSEKGKEKFDTLVDAKKKQKAQ